MIAQRDDVAPALPLDTIIQGDCLDVLRSLPDNSVDAIVTDPPYGLGAAPDMLDVLRAWLAGESYQPRGSGGFMGKSWDAFVPGPEYWRECLRVLKPGGHALVFAGTRTWDVMGLALRLAGFELRDTCQWLYGSGFPKSLDVSKQLDRMAGAQREVVGSREVTRDLRRAGDGHGQGYGRNLISAATTIPITAPATDAARQWDGWGTALKPAWEPIIVCRKPLSEPTVAANVLRWGTGALNIGASRVATDPGGADDPRLGGNGAWHIKRQPDGHTVSLPPATMSSHAAGRWPPNLLLSHAPDCQPDHCSLWCSVRELDAQSGNRGNNHRPCRVQHHDGVNGLFGVKMGMQTYDDTGGASRYFPTFRYVAKASRAERNRGLDAIPAKPSARNGRMAGTPEHGTKHDTPEANTHPCVKPQMLMSWLITLITPSGGVVLDPFAGSGSTLCAAKAGGWRYLGIEREAEYVAIAEARLEATP